MTRDDITGMARKAGFVGFDGENKCLREFAALAASAEREACVEECKKLFKVFLSSKYSTGQPLSSFKERHAVAACIEAIEARGNT